jgi:hypothetical protein
MTTIEKLLRAGGKLLGAPTVTTYTCDCECSGSTQTFVCCPSNPLPLTGSLAWTTSLGNNYPFPNPIPMTVSYLSQNPLYVGYGYQSACYIDTVNTECRIILAIVCVTPGTPLGYPYPGPNALNWYMYGFAANNTSTTINMMTVNSCDPLDLTLSSQLIQGVQGGVWSSTAPCVGSSGSFAIGCNPGATLNGLTFTNP